MLLVPARPGRPGRRSTLAAAAGCLVSFCLFLLAQRAAHVTSIDVLVYRAEGWTVRTGGDLYAMRATHRGLPATYPPFAALLFTALTLPGTTALRVLTELANLGLLLALVHLSLRLVDVRPRAAVTLTAAALCVWCEPVWQTLRNGQINLLVVVLVLWDLTRPAAHRWAGLGTGLATGIKLTPALFVVHLAATGLARRAGGAGAGGGAGGAGAAGGGPWLRRAAVATAAFAGTAVLAALALPYDSRRFWTDAVFATERVGHAEDTANQSLRGVLARLLHTGDPGAWWAVAALAVTVLGLTVAVRTQRCGPRATAWGALSCAATALLVSPVSWSHHWVWCVPAGLLLAREAAARGSRAWWAGTAVAAVLFCSYALWRVPHDPQTRPELRQDGGRMLLSAGYPAAGAAFLALAALRTAGAGPDRPARDGLSGRDPRGRRAPRDGTSALHPASPRTDASSPCPRAPAGDSGT
ncbi:glycosyltransferase 87 family protein [Streptomyces roseifaciens]|uniref:glycosyltransferase 87 family protein n=1 Tax=Streptomyces roseifaciens TaxID=1488406 RepID=UPI003B82D7BF